MNKELENRKPTLDERIADAERRRGNGLQKKPTNNGRRSLEKYRSSTTAKEGPVCELLVFEKR